MPPAHTGLEKHKRLMRHRRQRVREAVVRKAGVRKVEHADVVTCGRGKDSWKAAVRRAGKGRRGQARPADFAGEGSDFGLRAPFRPGGFVDMPLPEALGKLRRLFAARYLRLNATSARAPREPAQAGHGRGGVAQG